jgi:DNA helicase-2/ATP-dependent DNA helicase PcrA
MVIAGPGSGKTELLGLRVANILRRTDARAQDVLCLTFTDAAARNMRERLAGLIGNDAYKVAIHTFHSFGSEIISRHSECFYQGAVYAPIDEISKTGIIEDIIKELKWHSRFKSFHPQQGYTYLGSIVQRIDDLKKGGLTPGEFEQIILENKAFEEEAGKFINKVFTNRISVDMLLDLHQLVADLKSIPVAERQQPLAGYRTLKQVVLLSLEEMIREAEDTEEKRSKTKPITAWKGRWLKKDAKGRWQLESHSRNKDLLDLAKVYDEYQKRIHAAGFYDFADMILDTVRALETVPELRYELQEKYLYVLVDEFQDTSGVQMRLLDALLSTEVNEGRPNVLAVGDDDQSIYKFQGASLENMNEFIGRYRDVKKIVLTHNYRSSKDILDYSQSVIGKAGGRLAGADSDVVKELVAANSKIKPGVLAQKEFETKIEEYIYICEEIKRLKESEPALEIAVISRKHEDLEDMSVLLNYYALPVSYERNRNILEEKHINEIITIARFVDSLNRKGKAEADEYLPDILSFPFFAVERIDIWKISTLTHKNYGRSWLETMLGFGGKAHDIAEWLIALGTQAKRQTMEEVLDYITGARKIDGVAYSSGFKEYYFSKENFDSDRLQYLECLFDLQTLFGQLRKFRTRQTLYIKDLIEFIELHETHHIPIYEPHRLSKGKDAVELLTAHKAKGLEYDAVFIINCNENSWMKGKSGQKLPLPSNVPLTPEEDNIDDRTRLFFVAVTRAKSRLYLTNYCHASGEKKASERLRFLDQDLTTEAIEALPTEKIRTAEDLILFQEELRHYELRSADEKELLRSLLEDYKLSATHLNNFLDVTKGGPASFLEINLLRFPGAKNAASSYGTAVHGSFNELYKRFKEKGKLPKQGEFLRIFEDKLRLQELSEKDFAEKLEQGKDELGLYYEENAKLFRKEDLLAVGFKTEGVLVDEAQITGEIDRLSLEDEERKIFKVYDYKTGKPFESWSPTDDYLKIKSRKYHDQLVFYKLLVENSRSFGRYRINEGCIEFLTKKGDELLRLELEITQQDVERMRALIGIVYKKIMALDFPDVSKYPANAKGIAEFEEDLLAGRI